MIFESQKFTFQPPVEVAFARRILIKPSAAVAQPHPITTSTETIAAVISEIRKVSSADIVILESSARAKKVHEIYKELGYDFPNTMLLDVDQCVPVAIENPLPKPFAIPTFWVPNIILSCDFLISIAPFKIVAEQGCFSIRNLLGLLPSSKYKQELKGFRGIEQQPGIDSIIADLYFTLPFDLGIIDARKKLISPKDHYQGKVEDYNQIFVGTPLEVDTEASRIADVSTGYLKLIEEIKAKQGGG